MEAHIVTQQLVVGQMGANCYLVYDEKTKEGYIIDPGDESEYVMNNVRTVGMQPTHIIATHGHFDHIMGALALQATYQIPFLMHQADTFLLTRMKETAEHFLGAGPVDPPPLVTQTLDNMDTVAIGETASQVLHTPGHTPGSICLYLKKEKMIFVGDSLFAGGGLGRTDFSYADKDTLHTSILHILSLPDDTVVYPGHGEKTTVAREKIYHKSSI